MTPSGRDTWGGRLERARERLAAAGIEEAAVKLRWLAAHLLGGGLLEVALHAGETPRPGLAEAFERGVERLETGEPVQYVIGETDFMGFRIRCDCRALIPRPETEQLAGWAEDYLRGRPGRPVVVDACTGTGCLACVLALRLTEVRVLATDCSADALDLARENARALGADVEFIQTDLLGGLPEACADLVISNPPYIDTGACEHLPSTVRDFEPRLALDGGRGGLEIISRLVSDAAHVMVNGGRLMLEIGEDQAAAVQELVCRTTLYNPPNLKCDYAGRDRVVWADRRPRRRPR